MRNIPEDIRELQDCCGTRIINNEKSMIKAITSKEEYNAAIICSELKNTSIKENFKWVPMDVDWKNRCKKFFWFQDSLKDAKRLHPTMSDDLFFLKEKLLSFGGNAACLPFCEDDLQDILQYGQFWLGNNVKRMSGKPSQCHKNSCRLWLSNKEVTRICTGYALSSDGMWRQHSWLIWIKERSNQIIETTIPRIGYFGFAMTTEQCEAFCEVNNIW